MYSSKFIESLKAGDNLDTCLRQIKNISKLDMAITERYNDEYDI